MNKKRIINIILLLSCISIKAYPQEELKILVSNTDDNAIHIKWYSSSVFLDKAVDIYRKTEKQSAWQKINSSPLKRKTEMSQQLKNTDKIFVFLDQVLSSKKAMDLDGITLLTVLLKSIEVPEFSDYLGIQFIDKNVSKDETYQYKITETSSGKDIAFSAMIKCEPYESVGAPENFTLNSQGMSVALSWQVDEDRFAGVNIYRSDNKGEFKKLNDMMMISSRNEKGEYPEHLFVDHGVEDGNYYTYKITSIDYFGRESQYSQLLGMEVIDPESLPLPYNIRSDIKNDGLHLYWEISNTNVLKGYHIYRSAAALDIFERVNKTLVTKEENAFVDKTAIPGLYLYRISSVDKNDQEKLSGAFLINVPDTEPPDPPYNIKIQSDTGKMILSWNHSKSKDLLGYSIYRSIKPDDENTFLLLNSSPVQDSFFIDEIPAVAQNTFYYKIAALDTSYNISRFHDILSNNLPDINAPNSAVILGVEFIDQAIRVRWLDGIDENIKGYHVYRSTEKSGWEKINISPLKNVNFYTDYDVNPDIEYFYRLVVENQAGNISEPSQTISALLVPVKINKLEISDFSGNYRKNRKTVSLTWKIKNEDDALGYTIFRGENTSDVLLPVSGLIRDKSFADKDLPESESVIYQLRVYLRNGDIIKSIYQTIKIK